MSGLAGSAGDAALVKHVGDAAVEGHDASARRAPLHLERMAVRTLEGSGAADERRGERLRVGAGYEAGGAGLEDRAAVQDHAEESRRPAEVDAQGDAQLVPSAEGMRARARAHEGEPGKRVPVGARGGDRARLPGGLLAVELTPGTTRRGGEGHGDRDGDREG